MAVGKDMDPLIRWAGVWKEHAHSGKEGEAGKERQSRCGAADKPAQNNKRLHHTSVRAGESGHGRSSSACASSGQWSSHWHQEKGLVGF